TPSLSVRDSLQTTTMNGSLPSAEETEPTWQADLARLGLTPAPVDLDEKIILLRGVLQQPCIYLERLTGAGAGDCGWYVGSVENPVEPKYDAVAVRDLLSIRPELEPVLQLPPGYLIVLDGPALVAVLDATDQRVRSFDGASP